MELLNVVFSNLEQRGFLPPKYKPHKLPETTKIFGNAMLGWIGY